MTDTPAAADIVIIGAGARGRTVAAALAAAGFTDVEILDQTPGTARHVVGALFDDGTDSWLLSTTDGETLRASVVIAAHRPVYLPWTPELVGRSAFRGEMFHAVAWDPAFDPAGKRIAVVGGDAAAGHHIGSLIGPAASVTVFAYPPRRVVSEIPPLTTRAKRWLARHTRMQRPRPTPRLVGAPIESLTSSGIRTSDGVEHGVDAIIFGTGFAIPDQICDHTLVGARGVTIRQAWPDGMEPFLGVAVHGFPNYFFLTGPDIRHQARYLVECLALLKRTASTRIEVRRSSQQVFNERAQLGPARPYPVTRAFDLSSSASADHDAYDGAATLQIAGSCHPVHVRLTGHLDPIDGHYHWQGTVRGPLPRESLLRSRSATLSVGRRSVPARLTEETPWGTHSVAGVGAPPYPMSGR
ncbi:hypothetical protein MSHI_01290 [Mycobacterium shinjukuense]|uniref:DUF4873 domain-containing protein n=1 Tax=Mycobacterium shinjukuense TaxID=398694 RepID=A0A7I7ML03_9MYCO|nr:hypothetical protein MSHI_01290 [Mycobacterium shinjukuense]